MLFTGADKAYEPLSRLTIPLMQRYADRHGYTFQFHGEPLLDVPEGIYWTGVCGAKKAIEDGYDRAIYLDVDQQITNMDFEMPGWTCGFHVSKDWGEDAIEPWQFSMCGFIAHPDSYDLFKEALRLEPEWRGKPFPEQNIMQHLLLLRRLGEASITLAGCGQSVHERKLFNCVPDQVCPGKVPEPWVPGDFAAHLTMLPIDERVKLFYEIQKQL